MYLFFFFSSRRRHTRWNCDWSSNVCSSDLRFAAAEQQQTLAIESAMEVGKDFPLQVGFETAEHVAATDEVEALERRLAHQIVPGEDAQRADRPDHPPRAALGYEIPLAPPPRPRRRRPWRRCARRIG